MTTLPGSGQLSLLQVRDHLGETGEVALPDDLYRGQYVPDMQQLTGSGRFSNDTGARFQVLRLFIHDGFMSGPTAGPSYRIEFDTNPTGPLGTPIIQAFPTNRDADGAIDALEEAIGDVYPSFVFSTREHHTAQASSVEINCTNASTVSSGTSTIYLHGNFSNCLLYTSPSPRDRQKSRMPSSA